ncbi:MAG: leucyl/phenylalanyl-tRNA--protein transferase [Pseudorhodoplanes sp.]|nr:leucyl/phenylalanyl-tRNA--protein transferase [Pseudorhodoplanes sp.]
MPPHAQPANRAARRTALFRETPRQAVLRNVLGIARCLKPARARSALLIARHVLAGTLGNRGLPDPRKAPDTCEGLCGIAYDLSVDTLMRAYRIGLHASGLAGPPKWWSPPRRAILDFENFHMSRRLRSRLRQNRHRVTFDRDFEGVIAACAEPRPGKLPISWITPQVMHLYAEMHDAGHAHSFEVWDANGSLVGGGYGVAIGGIFIIESQFARETHASKIGFCMLNWHLAKWGFALNDNKGPAQNVLDMGFHVIPREEYLDRLANAIRMPDKPGRWEVETDLATVAQWEPKHGRPQNEMMVAAE